MAASSPPLSAHHGPLRLRRLPAIVPRIHLVVALLECALHHPLHVNRPSSAVNATALHAMRYTRYSYKNGHAGQMVARLCGGKREAREGAGGEGGRSHRRGSMKLEHEWVGLPVRLLQQTHSASTHEPTWERHSSYLMDAHTNERNPRKPTTVPRSDIIQ